MWPIDPHLFAAFIAAGLLLNVTPGPDMLFVLATGSDAGPRTGARAAAGIGVGSVVHTIAATVGLSQVLATSAAAFAVVKYVGAAYLVYLGLAALLRRAGDREPVEPPPVVSHVFRRAIVTNVLNPKVALFFLAFVPQFVSVERGNVALQFALLGLTFCTTGTAVNLLVGLASGRIARVLRERRSVKRVLDRVVGAVFIALGIRLALAEAR
ncbi:MAG TPA: LysE family translocator [Kofleriaceae bacterium]|jgi:threonine/homoserine/homoserine lactone efflux protein|nr:LysE family translocator [Kofleriaceae bacterium]